MWITGLIILSYRFSIACCLNPLHTKNTAFSTIPSIIVSIVGRVSTVRVKFTVTVRVSRFSIMVSVTDSVK